MAGYTLQGLGLAPSTAAATAAASASSATPGANAAGAGGDTLQPGITVEGKSGTTELPAASPSDFTSGNPTPLDEPHPQYPQLISSHVAVLQAIGTPAGVIEMINGTRPQAEAMDRYIQGEIMEDPEGWDAYVGNPRGTARMGLLAIDPKMDLPAPGQGHPGYMDDGTPVSGISAPVLTKPILDPTTGGISGDGAGNGLLLAAGVAVAGVVGWKLLKNRKAAAAAAAVTPAVANAVANVGTNNFGGGGRAAFLNAFQNMAQLGGSATTGTVAQSLGDARMAVNMQAYASGAASGDHAAGAALAAGADFIMGGGAPAHPDLVLAANTAAVTGRPYRETVNDIKALNAQAMVRLAIENNQIGDLGAMALGMNQLEIQRGANGARAGQGNGLVDALRQAFGGT